MATEDGRKLFVAGLAASITEDVLRQLFEAAGGTVVEISLPKDRATGQPRGFGFVTLDTDGEAETVMSALDGSMQAGRSISVRPFRSDPQKRGGPRGGGDAQQGNDRTLYVGNLPYDASQQDIETLFGEAGVEPIVRVHLPVGQDGRPRGFAFVTLGSASSATTAVDALAGAEMRGRRLVINIAHPKGERPPRGPRGDRPPAGDRPPPRDRPPRAAGGPGDAPAGSAPAPSPGGFEEPRRTFDDRRRDNKRGKKRGGSEGKPAEGGGKRRRGGGGKGRGRRGYMDWEED